MTIIDNYITTLTPETQVAFERIRRIAQQAVPGTEDGISYGVHAIMLRGRPLIGFAVTKKHLSIYPFSGKVIDKLRDKLADFGFTSGAIHFTEAKPIPESLLKEIIAARLQEIEERERRK